MRRKVLHIERCRHLGILDDFVCTVMYPQLGHGQLSLTFASLSTSFGDEVHELTSAEIDTYVDNHLPESSDSTRQATRNKLRYLLVKAGLVQRTNPL